MCQQPGDAVLDQVDAGRFDRFEEARGESQRDDIAAPRPLPHPGPEAQRPRLGERPALDVGEQNRRRLVLAEEVAAKDMAVARPVLERDDRKSDVEGKGVYVRVVNGGGRILKIKTTCNIITRENL